MRDAWRDLHAFCKQGYISLVKVMIYELSLPYLAFFFHSFQDTSLILKALKGRVCEQSVTAGIWPGDRIIAYRIPLPLNQWFTFLTAN